MIPVVRVEVGNRIIAKGEGKQAADVAGRIAVVAMRLAELDVGCTKRSTSGFGKPSETRM